MNCVELEGLGERLMHISGITEQREEVGCVRIRMGRQRGIDGTEVEKVCWMSVEKKMLGLLKMQK